VIAPSFGDIFASNAVNNGLLPALVPEAEVEALLRAGEALELTVDLEAMTIEGPGFRAGFTVDPVWRLKLLNGWDDIDLTLAQADRINAFVADHQATRPWAFPRRP
jgi:3-isopropylmalate/(R)-2-methylmalate dehydratase small subunit